MKELQISLISLILYLSSFCLLNAQMPDLLWTQTYGTVTANDVANSIERTADGGFIMGCGGFATIMKTDIHGDTIWTRNYGANANAIRQTSDSGYIIACGDSIDLIKTDLKGDSVWMASYGMEAADVRQTPDDGYIVAGSFALEGQLNACLIKTNEHGEIVWQQIYIRNDVSHASGVRITDDGGYITAGMAHSEAGCWDYLLIRTDSYGDTVWTRTYGRPGEADEGYAVCRTSDGGYIMTGLYFWTVKSDSNGDTLWTRYYGYGEIGCAYSIEQTSDGGCLIVGTIDPVGQDEGDFYIVKTDSLGNAQWELPYGSSYNSNDRGYGAFEGSNGRYVITGKTRAAGAEDFDFDISIIKVSFLPELYLYLPGDANMPAGQWPPRVIGSDLTYLVNVFMGNVPPCLYDGFYAAPDINGDGQVIGSDVTRFVNYFRGYAQLHYCPDFPPAWPTIEDLPEDAPEGWPDCE